MSSKLSKRAAASSADIAQTDFAAYGPRYPLPDESAVAHSRQTREDLAGAFSGYGHTGYCPEGIPVEQAIFGILAAFAASFGFLFRAITMITGGRKKRSADGNIQPLTWEEISGYAGDMVWYGRCQPVIHML